MLAAAALCVQLLPAADVFLHGKGDHGRRVASARKSVGIERSCMDSETAIFVAATNPRGEFTYKITIEGVNVTSFNRSCVMRAAMKGYESTSLDYNDWNLFQDPNLPPIVLIKLAGNPSVNVFSDVQAPRKAFKTWSRAGKEAQAGHWPESREADSGFASGLSAIRAGVARAGHHL